MSATRTLREDHKQVRRLDTIIVKCYTKLQAGGDIPLEDIEKITIVINEFLDSIHYSREEDSYFPCVASYDHLKQEIRGFLIEHEFSRRIALQIQKYLREWKKMNQNAVTITDNNNNDGTNKGDAKEPVARYLKTYSVYLNDHMNKEEAFFDKAELDILSSEEERDMYEQFNSVMATSQKLTEMIKEIELLENKPWCC